jgi:hypothetical protein
MNKKTKFEMYLSDIIVDPKTKNDVIGYNKKGKPYKISAIIQNQFKKTPLSLVTIDELASHVTINKAFKPVKYIEPNNISYPNIEYTTALCIDIDNKDRIMSIEKAKKILFDAKIPYHILYLTSSYKASLPKFRFIIFLATPLNNDEFHYNAQKLLKGIFDKNMVISVDEKSYAINQYFMGSNGIIIETKYDELLELKNSDYYINNFYRSKGVNWKNLLNKFNKNFIYTPYGEKMSLGGSSNIKGQPLPTHNNSPQTASNINNELYIELLDIEQSSKEYLDNHELTHYIDNMKKRCPLFNKFINLKKLRLPELQIIVTNLNKMRGGLKFFWDTYNQTADLYNNFDYETFKIKETINEFKKIYLCHNCSFYNECPNYSNNTTDNKTILSQLQIKGISDRRKMMQKTKTIIDDYADLNDIREDLGFDINNIQLDKKIHLYIAEPGTGKTTTVLRSKNIMQYRFGFFVPTHNKIKEIDNEFIFDKNVKFSCEAPEIPAEYNKEKAEIENNWKLKLPGNLDIYSNFAKNKSEFGFKCQEYIKSKLINHSKYSYIGTHAELVMNIEKFKSSKELLIIDEDFINSALKINISKLSDIDNFIEYIKTKINNQNNKLNEKYKDIIDRLNLILDIKEKTINRVSNKVDEKLYKNLVISFKNKLDSPLLNLIYDKYFMKDLYGQIHSISKMVNLTGITTVILSATLSVELYKLLFGEKNVVVHEYKKLKKYYDISQYSKYTMSKESINDLHSRGLLKEYLKDSYSSDVVFTHKTGLNFNIEDYFSKNTKIRFFGPSSQGINEFAGKNICLLGTPRPNNTMSFMMYAAITDDINITNKKISNNEIDRGNFRGLDIKLFEDPILKNIQINYIDSCVLQAKGRSREVIKTEDNPWMHIYSNFPIDDPSIILK